MLEELFRHYQQNQLAHAYLIVGNFSVILPSLHQFLASIFCNSFEGSLHEPQDCVTCSQIQRHEHPHLVFCHPQGRSVSISVDQTRQLLEAIQTTPILQHQRFVIIEDIDKMTLEAINSFLKTLEEPPSQTVFITQTSVPQKLLPTLLSRMRLIQTFTSDPPTKYPYLTDALLSLFYSDQIDALELVQSAHEYIKKESKSQSISASHYLSFLYQLTFSCIHYLTQSHFKQTCTSQIADHLSDKQLKTALERYSLDNLSDLYERLIPLHSFLIYSPSVKAFLSELFMLILKK